MALEIRELLYGGRRESQPSSMTTMNFNPGLRESWFLAVFFLQSSFFFLDVSMKESQPYPDIGRSRYSAFARDRMSSQNFLAVA